jgi:hypothetical protein
MDFLLKRATSTLRTTTAFPPSLAPTSPHYHHHVTSIQSVARLAFRALERSIYFLAAAFAFVVLAAASYLYELPRAIHAESVTLRAR